VAGGILVKMAKLICRGCPVSVTCLSWALASGEEAGRRHEHDRACPRRLASSPFARARNSQTAAVNGPAQLSAMTG